MEKTKEETKAAILKLRQQIKENASRGGHHQRTLLLAYGYIRGRAYSSMERTTNARSHCAIGKYTYYSGLAFSVANRLLTAFSTEERDPYKFTSEEYNATSIIKKDIIEWMRDHWDVPNEEAA